MGVVIPQVVTEDRASGAQFIGGSLRFDSSKSTYLTKTLSSAGDRTMWTWSGWVKRSDISTGRQQIFGNTTAGAGPYGSFEFGSDDLLYYYDNGIGSGGTVFQTTRKFRDPAWYHIVIALDTSQSTDATRIKVYVNGVQETSFTTLSVQSSGSGYLNDAAQHNFGSWTPAAGGYELDAYLAEVHFIEGQQLTADSFGFTDLLTGTWRPKKYEGTFGTNGFYLPFDGNSPIGQDKSGSGNNFTPINFGGSVALDKATGAKPILNTTPGGTQASVGVFGSKENRIYKTTSASNSGGKYYFSHDASAQPTFSFIRGATYTFDWSASTSHPLRFSATDNGTWGGGTEYQDGVDVTGNVTTITVPHDAPPTLYYYCNVHSGMGNSISVTTDESKADKYASNCILALPLVGVKNDVSASIACTSSTKAVTVTGDAAASSDKSNFYSGSFEFDGTGDRLTLDIGAGGLGSGDFTIEFWSNSDTTSGSRGQFQISPTSGGLQGASTSIAVYQGSGAGFYQMYVNNNSSSNSIAPTDSNKWNHFAVVRSGSTQKMYVNGIESVSGSSSIDYTTARYLCIGGYYSTSYLWDGCIQDFRIYKGVAKYTSDFIPASTSPNVLPDTPSGVAGSSKLTKITDGAVSFDGSGDYLELSDSADFDLGSGDFTIEFFVYTNSTSRQALFTQINSGGTDASTSFFTEINSSAQWRFVVVSTDTTAYEILGGTAITNKWTHIACVRDGNTATLYVDGISVGTDDLTGVTVKNSSEVVSIGRYPGGLNFSGFISNLRLVKGTALYTSNFTPPTRTLTNVTNTKLLCCQSDTLVGGAAVAPYGGSSLNNGTAWNTFLSSADDTDNSESFKLFDGNISTIYSPGANTITFDVTSIGGITVGTALSVYYSSGVTSRDFSVNGGGTVNTGTGQKWVDLGFTGTLNTLTGTNGGQIGAISVDGEILRNQLFVYGDAAATNFNPFNTDINKVRGQESGYATLNPNFGVGRQDELTYSNGNLTVASGATGGNDTTAVSTLPIRGKIYCEFFLADDGVGAYVGVMKSDTSLTNNGIDTTASSDCWLIRGDNEHKANGGGGSGSDYGDGAWATGDLIMMAVDIGTGSIWWGKNGIWYATGNPSTNSNAAYTNLPSTDDLLVMCGDNYSSETPTIEVNFGQKPFKFPPPNGFQTLNQASIRPVKVITRPDQFVGAILYSGSGSTQSISGLGFKPDLVWVRRRNGNGNHNIQDSVRGAEYYIQADDDMAQSNSGSRLSSFDDDGFTLTSDNGGNNSSGTYVGYCWKAGTSFTPTVTGGFSSPSASINTDAGFGIYKLTGANSQSSFTTGLNQAADFILAKALGESYDWGVYHSSYQTSLPSAKYLELNESAVPSNKGSDMWEQAGTTIEVHSYAETGSNTDYIYYVWHNVPGLQKFGKYEGNDNADGPFIELGFRPAIVWVKNIDANEPWVIYDNTRGPNNPNNKGLYANSTAAENDASGRYKDFLSNGFKIRGDSGEQNDNNTYIYCAWAEAPTVNLFGGQSNAR